MKNITNPKLLYLKAVLFLLTGIIAVTIILLEVPTLKIAALLVLAIWCFARTYYFIFYVIEKYIDPSYRFAGLFDFACYLFKSRKHTPKKPSVSP